MRTLLAFAAVAMLVSPAFAKETSAVTWTEIETPDGSGTARLPCAAAEIERSDIGKGGFEIICRRGDHVFNVVSGLPSTEESNEGAVNSFDYLYNMTQKSPLASMTRLDKIGSHRRATIGCRGQDGPMCIILVDRGDKPPLALAYSGDAEAYFDLPEAEQAEASTMIAAFADSLEMRD
jgi:hypothetical protein